MVLYAIKLKTFKYKTKDHQKPNKISVILWRIIILSIFYEIFTGLVLIASMSGGRKVYPYVMMTIIYLLPSIIYEYSMYLVLEHNTKEYITFLKVLVNCRCNYVCFCLKRIIDQQLSFYYTAEKEYDEMTTMDDDKERIDLTVLTEQTDDENNMNLNEMDGSEETIFYYSHKGSQAQ